MPAAPNAALSRLRSESLALGFGVGLLATPAMAQLAKLAGYHWLGIDMEHSPLDLKEVAQLSLAAVATGIAPIVRTKFEGLHEGVRALDSGAQGLLVPSIEPADQARRIVAAARFAPAGSRGWGGSAPTFGFAPPPVTEATSQLNRETLLAVMIETRRGLENVEEIAAVAGIDVLFVGTVDLGLDLGFPSRFDEPRLWESLKLVANACRRHGRSFGVGGLYDEASLPALFALGCRLLAGGGDHAFLLQAARARAKLITEQAERHGVAV
jgi:2-keto-3-deoxy-L-rhamnonate aldolase RhmA